MFYSDRFSFRYIILASLKPIILESHENVQTACAKRIPVVVSMWD